MQKTNALLSKAHPDGLCKGVIDDLSSNAGRQPEAGYKHPTATGENILVIGEIAIRDRHRMA